MDAIQAHREASVRTAVADDVLLFAGMSGVEELGRLSEFTVRLLSPRTAM
jgi:type VI secretion system secreted protein VgrG